MCFRSRVVDCVCSPPISAIDCGRCRNHSIRGQNGERRRSSRKGRIILFSLCAAALILGVILQAVELLENYVASRAGNGLDWMPMIRQVMIAVLLLSNLSLTIGNQGARLLFTDKGLFQVFDPNRLWGPDRDLHEPNSPLRIVRLFDWTQVARFHWSSQQGKCVLHLNVRQPEFPVPQLHSYKLPLLSEEGRQELDQILRKYAACVASQPGGCNLTGVLQNALGSGSRSSPSAPKRRRIGGSEIFLRATH